MEGDNRNWLRAVAKRRYYCRLCERENMHAAAAVEYGENNN